MKKQFLISIYLFILLFLYPATFSQAIDEYTLKAVWLSKFTHFIKWPKDKIDTANTFSIGVLSDNNFKETLDTIYTENTILNKPVTIKYFNTIESINNVHILYVSPNFKKDLDRICDIAQKKSILLIGDTKGYAEKGVHINFFTEDSKIRFEINEKSMQNCGFFVSFRLLNIAKIVEPIAQR